MKIDIDGVVFSVNLNSALSARDTKVQSSSEGSVWWGEATLELADYEPFLLEQA